MNHSISIHSIIPTLVLVIAEQIVVAVLLLLLLLLLANFPSWTNSTAVFDTVAQAVAIQSLDG